MPIHIDNMLALLLDVSIKAALLALIASGLLFVLRVRNANLQHRVWSAALVAMLALPLLIGVVPQVPVPIAKFASVVAVQRQEVAPVTVQQAAMQQAAVPVVADKLTTRTAVPVSDSMHETKPAIELPAAPIVAAPRINWPLIIAVAYLMGVGWFALRLFIGIWRARQLVCYSHAIELPPKQQPMVGATSVRESSLVRVPLTVGWWRLTIVLPSDWRSWDESLLTAVLSHEQEHVRRGDPWMTLLAEVNRALYWFHPVAWFLRRRLSTLAEAACDDAVVALSGDRASYARHLLTVAGRLASEPRRLVPVGVAMARTPQVERRINAVLDANRPLARRLSIATSLAVAVIAIFLATLTASLRASDESPAAATPTLTSTPTPLPVPPATQPPTVGPPKSKGDGWYSRPYIPQNDPEFALLSAGPIREITTEADGGFTFEFPINVPKGRKFGISFGERPIRVAALAYSLWEKEVEGPVSATLQLGYLKDSKPKQRGGDETAIDVPRGGWHSKDSKHGGVFQSRDQWMEYRLKVPNAYPFGISTLAGVPLNNLPPDERKVILIPSDSPLAKASTGIRLLLIVRKDQDPKTAAEVEKIEPRGELIVSLAPIEKPKPEPTPQQRLAEAWRQAESGIGTFFVRYQHLFGSPSWFKPLDAETVRKIVDDAAAKHLKPGYGSSDTDAEQSYAFVTEILRATLSDEQLKRLDGNPIKLAQNEFRMVGAKTFNIEGTRPGETPWEYRLFDGDVDLRYDSTNRQLNVLKAGQSHVARNTLGDFRALTGALNFRLNDFDKALADSQVKTLPNGRVLLSFGPLGPLEIVADPQSGFVERFSIGRGQNVEDEILQFGPKEFPGKQAFPRSKLDFEYRDGKLSRLSVYTSDELRVNEGFSDSDFTLKLPAGVTVVDYRVSESRPDSFKVDTEIPDAVEFAKIHLGRKPVTKPLKK